jgi:hypothetical protein
LLIGRLSSKQARPSECRSSAKATRRRSHSRLLSCSAWRSSAFAVGGAATAAPRPLGGLITPWSDYR